MCANLRDRVANADTSRTTITKAALSLESGAPGSRERVASVQFNRPHSLLEGYTLDLALLAYEEFTSDATAGDSETFDLSHQPVDSGATDPFVLYDDGERVEPDSVDYEAETFTYTDAETGSTLAAYYASGAQAQVEVQKTAPNGTNETLLADDIGLVHMRDTAKEPLEFEFSHFWQSTIPQDWTLDIFVKAPYTVTFAMDVDGDGQTEPATNAIVSFPAVQADENIDGLKRAVRMAAADR